MCPRESGAVSQALTAKRQLVEDGLKERQPLPEIMTRLGLDPGNKGLRGNFTHALLEDKSFKGLLKAWGEDVGRENLEEGRPTTPTDIANTFGMQFSTAKQFIGAGIMLPTPEEVEEKQLRILKARRGRGQGIKKIAARLLVGPDKIKELMRKGNLDPTELAPAPFRDEGFQNDILRALVLGPVGNGERLALNAELARFHPRYGQDGASMESMIGDVHDVKNILAKQMAEILGETFRSDMGLFIHWNSFNALMAKPPGEHERFVAEERKLLKDAGQLMGEHEARVTTALAQRLSERLGDPTAKTEEFAGRLFRMGLYGVVDNVFNPKFTTPQTLQEVEANLRDGDGRPVAEIVKGMNSYRLSQTAKSFFTLVRGKMAEGPRGRLDEAEVAETVRFLLSGEATGEPGVDWGEKEARRQALEGLIAEKKAGLGADATDDDAILAVRVNEDLRLPHNGLITHYRNRGANSYNEAFLMMLDEFGRLGPEWSKQRLTLETRYNSRKQEETVLRFYDRERPMGDYVDRVGMSADVVRDAMARLSDALTLAAQRGKSVRRIADEYGVGARGVSRLMGECAVDGRVEVRTAEGRRSPSSDFTLPLREDMRPMNELGEALFEAAKTPLLGVPAGKAAPSASIEWPESLKPLRRDVREIVAAAAVKKKANGEFDNIGMRASMVLEKDIPQAREVAEADRTVRMFTGRVGRDVWSIAPVTDAQLKAIEELTRAIKDEASHKYPAKKKV
jgi:hypothetical protein